MKKLTALLLAIAMMVTCTLCAVAEDGKTYMAVCIASEPDTLDPALNSAVDGATMVAHLFRRPVHLGADRRRQAGNPAGLRGGTAGSGGQ